MQNHLVLHSVIVFAALSSLPAEAADPASAGTQNPAPFLSEVCGRAEAALARPDLAAYRGWIKFLRFEAETAAARGAAGGQS